MAISKITLNGDTQMDVTNDTVVANHLLDGDMATGANGERIRGTLQVEVVVDPTLSNEGEAADAKVTGNYIADLQGSILFDSHINENRWWNKSYSSATGAISDSNIRICTIDYISKLIKSATPISPYQIGIIAWDSNDVYQGMWSGTEFVKTGLTWQTSKVTFSELGNYNYRILLRRSNDAAITTSAYTNVTIEYITESMQDATDTELERLSSEIKYQNCLSLFENGYYTTNGTYIGSFVSASGYRSCVLNVIPGDKLHLTGIGASSARLWAFADKDKAITRRADSGASMTNGELTVADGECYFVYNADNSSNLYKPALSIEIDKAKTLETLRLNVNDIATRIPVAPTTNGTYTLRCVVSGGTPTYSWVSV